MFKKLKTNKNTITTIFDKKYLFQNLTKCDNIYKAIY